MRYLRTNTATRITVGPFLDKTDGITPEVAITVTSEKLTLVVDTAGVPTLILDVAPTASGGANDMVHITGDDSGYYDLELAAADVNYFGRAVLSLNDVATHCPVFHEFMIVPAMIYDAMFLGTDVLDASVTQLLGTAWLAPGTAGTPDVNVKLWNALTTVALPLVPATAGRTLVVDAAGLADANAVKLGPSAGGTAQTARDIGASVLLSTGTGTGQLDFTSGVVKANLAQILGTAITETAGQIAAAFKKFFDKATPTGTINSIPDAVAGAANGLFIAGTNAATAITTALTANITGNLSGSVGSVTGAVGSVTGAIGSVAAGGITAASVATGAIDADALASDAVTEIRSVVSGTSDSGTTTTMVDAARTEADTDYWAGDIILFTSGNISGQARVITAFDPATDTITFTPATTQAVATQTYEIISGARAVLAGITHTSARIPNVTLTDTVTTYTGNTPQTGDVYPKVDTEIATIITDVAAVKADTAAILVDTGTTLDGRIPAVLVSGRMDSSVGAMAAGVVTAAAVATDAIDADALAADAAAELADAVWDEDATAHQTLGTYGQAIGDPVADTNTIYKSVVTDAAGATVGIDVVAVKADTAAIKLKTDNLPSDPADESLLEAAILAAWTTALTESYNADGVAPTPAQALFVIMQTLTEFAITSTTLTVKKLNGTTTALTLTLDSATTPTSATRAT